MVLEAANPTRHPDPPKTLTGELELTISEEFASRSSEYDQGVIAGLSVAAHLVEREQQHQRALDEEHVPGRVYGPREQA
jgi:hypothetical protein